jgi:hypothetical protein
MSIFLVTNRISILKEVHSMNLFFCFVVFPINKAYNLSYVSFCESDGRFITPYTDYLDKLLIYAKSNKIDYLIVDSLDFYTYRKDLQYLLDNKKEFR